MALELERQTTVMFAAVLGTTAPGALAASVEQARKAAEANGVRVVNRAADKLMILAATPEAAADAAAAMHAAMDGLPAQAGAKLTLGIAFHHGPVIQQGEQVFGDTVNLAAQLLARAASGQIITTRETAVQLPPLYRAWMRQLYSIDIKGRSGQVALCELVWRTDDNTPVFAKRRAEQRPAAGVLRLSYRGKQLVRRRAGDAVTLGRDENCGIPIADSEASRLHCTIERRQDKFVLIDHSTNGTYVAISGGDEVLVQREEFTLSGRGTIACGEPAVSTKEIVRFSVD